MNPEQARGALTSESVGDGPVQWGAAGSSAPPPAEGSPPVGHHCHRSLQPTALKLERLRGSIEVALRAVAHARLRLEELNNFECGQDVNAAEHHLRAIKHRLERHG